MWNALQIAFVALGLLLAFGGDRLSSPFLYCAGIACFGLAMIALGGQAISTRRLVLRRGRGRYREVSTGVPAIFQGVQFGFAGLYLIGMAVLMYFDSGREVFLYMVRRPGTLLTVLGGLSLLQAMIIFWGAGESGDTPRGLQIVFLLLGRLFPGLIWLILGLTLCTLGMFDAIAPARFDEMGGKFLEELYGLR